ncbi:Acyl-CoA thioester hydrolase YbgC [Planctomycetes bacterium Poly30]|uniref:Acyl-CoA thioester hydrolase YbgC n=1 Tax=Saltatorellus ferox TaxID=2528018 RepID=A0A518EVJ9_9BACT|nr:Acyl-CoA thioester hydrolase YbgC [Planctomycetes bacterium Poly30]
MDTPKIPDFPHFVHETITRWSDEDRQGVLNNAVYMTLFEEARLGFSRMTEALEGGNFPFLLAQTNVRFVRPGRGGHSVRVEVSTTEVGRSSFRQAYRVRAENGDVWAEAEAALVCYDPATMETRPIPGDLREALEALMGD